MASERVSNSVSNDDLSMIFCAARHVCSNDATLRLTIRPIRFLNMNHSNTPPDSNSSTPTPTAFARLRQRPSSIAEEISTSTTSGEGFTIEDIPHISVTRNLYVQEASIDRRADAKRYSWIGDHGEYLIKMDRNRKLNIFWSCNECDWLADSQVYGTGTTSNAELHLLSKHRIRKPGGTIAVSSSPNVMAIQILGAKQRKISAIPITADAGHLFRKTLVRWTVKANIRLTGPEDEEFRNLI